MDAGEELYPPYVPRGRGSCPHDPLLVHGQQQKGGNITGTKDGRGYTVIRVSTLAELDWHDDEKGSFDHMICKWSFHVK